MATTPGVSSMERARKALRLFSHDYEFEAGVVTVALAIEAAKWEARWQERERCLDWAVSSAQTAEYVINAIGCGAPAMITK